MLTEREGQKVLLNFFENLSEPLFIFGSEQVF